MLLNELDNLFIKRIGVFFLCFLLFNLKKNIMRIYVLFLNYNELYFYV